MARESDSTRPGLDAPEGAGWVQIDVKGKLLWVWGWETIPAGTTKKEAQPQKGI